MDLRGPPWSSVAIRGLKRMKRKDRFYAGRQETLYDGHTYKHTYITYIHIYIPYILTYKHNILWRQAMPGVQ
jgi:hypothetical protein